jgi:hypothetical protein
MKAVNSMNGIAISLIVILVFTKIVFFLSYFQFHRSTLIKLNARNCSISFKESTYAFPKGKSSWGIFKNEYSKLIFENDKGWIVDASDYWVYNPSVALIDDRYLFVARFSWLKDIKCTQLGEFAKVRECIHQDPSKWTDSSIFGSLNEDTCIGGIYDPRYPAYIFENLDWDSGKKWMDTKLLVLKKDSLKTKNGVWVTSNTNEILDASGWHYQHKVLFSFVQMVKL